MISRDRANCMAFIDGDVSFGKHSATPAGLAGRDWGPSEQTERGGGGARPIRFPFQFYESRDHHEHGSYITDLVVPTVAFRFGTPCSHCSTNWMRTSGGSCKSDISVMTASPLACSRACMGERRCPKLRALRMIFTLSPQQRCPAASQTLHP